MDRRTRLARVFTRGVLALALVTSAASSTLGAPPALASGGSASVAVTDASAATSDACAGQLTAQAPALFSTLLKNGLPLISAFAPDVPCLSQIAAPPPSPSIPEVQTLPDVDASIVAMRAQSRIDVRWQATFLAPLGSGWLTIAPPDGIDGQGTMASTSWDIRTNGDRIGVKVNDKAIVDLPSKGFATSLRDILVDLPCYAPNASLHQDGQIERLEGRLSAGSGSEVLRQLTGLVIPGSPIGEMTLAINSGPKTWQSLDLRLVWAVIDVDVLGRRITWGPSGRVLLTFAGDQTGSLPRPAVLSNTSTSTAQMVVGRVEEMPQVRPYATTIDAVFTFLDVRQARAMIDEEPWRRATLAYAQQHYGENSSEYQSALRDYQAWEQQIPLVGPVLRYIFKDAGGS